MVEKLTVTGRLSRVETKFAFVETVNGSVFCPLAAAIPPSEHVPNFAMRYNTGDIVHVTMVPQEEKNGCKWRAVKVRGFSISNFILAHRIDPIAQITNVSETLAFASSDELGSVFIPGAAFSSEEVTRLNSHLSIGMLMSYLLHVNVDVKN
ncbi:unnamed protein product [Angiostrongylus costaricensis]|uniref:S1 motif domain-containing protein n=1 Tax=Angiostrongylus costaricensis TaxID=334426 RepID=A0A0R3PYM8_ANGCS|nr:unnamed protein product [Angiostrongylus costaricensis]